jgi:hypothetical protein
VLLENSPTPVNNSTTIIFTRVAEINRIVK